MLVTSKILLKKAQEGHYAIPSANVIDMESIKNQIQLAEKLGLPLIAAVAESRQATSVPLVLHGGSGSGDDNLSRCAKEGICKINIYTDIYLAAMKSLEEADASDYFKVRAALQKGMNDCLEHYYRVFGTRA